MKGYPDAFRHPANRRLSAEHQHQQRYAEKVILYLFIVGRQ